MRAHRSLHSSVKKVCSVRLHTAVFDGLRFNFPDAGDRWKRQRVPRPRPLVRSRCLFFHNSVRHDSLIATAGLTVAAIGYGGNLALRSLERYRHEHNENPLNSGNANHDQVSKDDLDAEHSDPESVRASSESGEGPRAEERPKDGNPRAFERPPISEQTNLEDAFKQEKMSRWTFSGYLSWSDFVPQPYRSLDSSFLPSFLPSYPPTQASSGASV